MSFRQPSGYRLGRRLDPSSLMHAVVEQGRPLRRNESIRVVAKVAAELAMVPHPDEVFTRLAHGLVSDSDIDAVCGPTAPIVGRAAAFVDAVHGKLHNDDTVDPWLDLRFELAFYSDPADAGGDLSFVLVSTNCSAFELAWRRVPSLRRYPLAGAGEDTGQSDEDWTERFETWERILSAYPRSRRLVWRAPPPRLYADIVGSLRDPQSDARVFAEGRITLTAVLAEVHRLLGSSAPSGLDRELVAAGRS